MAEGQGVIGDAYPTELPQAKVDPKAVMEEERMARYAKDPEFKRIKEHFEERIKFYQQYLPDGRQLASVPEEERGYMWLAANVIIGELRAVIETYETVAESVEEKHGRGNS